MNPDGESQITAEKKTLDRWPYFWWGCALMAVKYNIDRLIAWKEFNRSWYFWNYVKPHGFAALDALPPEDERFYFILLLTSLPFLAAGLFLTLRRLRSAGLSAGFCLLFFVPLINLIFFVILSLVPAKTNPMVPPPEAGWVSWLPTSAAGSALTGMGIPGVAGLGLAYFCTSVLRNYGWGLFVALPFTMGLVAVLIYAGPRKRGIGSCMLVAVLPIIFAGVGLFTVAVEGAVCLIMAAPIGVVLAMAGGPVGYAIVEDRTRRMNQAALMLVLIPVPFTMGMEKQAGERSPLLSVTTSVVIDAPPEKVWPNLISFPPIPEERDWILHTGVAYPTRARIDGYGVGAVRHCIFTTGEFVEPIEVWDKDRLLRFSVTQQPEPMEELSPYPHLKTPHLHGYFLTREGELRLTRLAGGKTFLEGTTWYTDEIWPSRYWQVWSDLMIHHVHLRVLNHIKNLSERVIKGGG